MDKLPLCRVCLSENFDYMIENTQLQDVYERLTVMPTNDLRPRAVCYICYAQLRTTRRFMMKCINAEQILTQMLNQLKSSDNKEDLQETLINELSMKSSNLSMTVIEQHNIDSYEDEVLIKQEIKFEPDDEIEPPDAFELTPSQTYGELTNSTEGKTAITGQFSVLGTPDVIENTPSQTYCEVKDLTKGKTEVREVCSVLDTPDATKLTPSQTYSELTKFTKGKTEMIKEFSVSDTEAAGNISQTYNQLTNYTNTEIKEEEIYLENTEKSINFPVINISAKDNSDDDNEYVITITPIVNTNNSVTTPQELKDTTTAPTTSHDPNNLYPRKYYPRPYACKLCPSKYSYKKTLNRHYKEKHSGLPSERPKCDICNKQFASNPILKSHLKIHSGEKPYECDVCQRAFSRKRYLSMHRKYHSAYRPYVCSICQQGFTERSYLALHVQNAHSNVRAFVCNICQMGFYSKPNLNAHLRIHSKQRRTYICDICQKSYAHKHNIIRHLATHNPFACPICQKKYKMKTYLAKHILSHGSDKR